MIAVATAGLLVLAGCLYSPLGTNQSTRAYATPDEKGLVRLTFPNPGNGEKATFQLREAADIAIAPDDSAGDGFVAVVDTTKLVEPGVYFVEMTVDNAESPSATLPFLKPKAAPAGV